LAQPTAQHLRRLVLATNNAHKVSEIRPLLEGQYTLLTLEDIGCHEELPETKDTLEGNSLQKASYLYEHYKLPCIADDSGLEVDALGGAPGVYSARYAGDQKSSEDNIQLLLKNLQGKSNRRAKFRTVITLIDDQGKVHQFEGSVDGEIIEAKRGTDGFGYDPVFLPTGYEKTFAEMDISKKNKFSHRARAIQKLVDFLKAV
jgi:XTP/dITP diphosphohydrolase